MEECLEDTCTSRFLPRKGKLRSVWLVGLNHRISRRDIEKINVVQICKQLIVMQSSFSVCSLFLLGVSRILERQVYYTHGDVNKLLYALKHGIASGIEIGSTVRTNRITLPSPQQLISTTFSPSTNNLSFSNCQYLPDSEFFIVEISEHKHTVASPLDITLPEDNVSSITYSINESVCDFSFEAGRPPLLPTDIANYSIDDESVILSNALGTPQLQSPADGGGFVSPFPNIDQPDNSILAHIPPVLLKKSVKRKLMFDKVTQYTEKKMKRDNIRSREKTLRLYSKFFNKESSLKLLSTPVNSLDVYSNDKLLNLWSNAVIASENSDDEIIKDQELSDWSIEIPRGRSTTTSYSNMSDNIGLSYSDISLNIHSVSNSIQDPPTRESSSHRVKGSYLGTLGGVGLLPPIPDLGGESDDDLPYRDYSNNSFDYDESDAICKSHEFYKTVLLPKMGRNKQVTFTELLPITGCSRLNASLAFMYTLGFVQQGLLCPSQTVPYGQITLKRGNNF